MTVLSLLIEFHSNKMRKGFTLIEILIFMGIAAVLLLLSFQGIQVLQRNSRDSERTTIGGQIDTLLNKYRRDNLKYPNNVNVTFQQNLFEIDGLVENVPLERFLKSAAQTNTEGTNYLYNFISSSEYQLCVRLESGAYKGFGTAACPN